MKANNQPKENKMKIRSVILDRDWAGYVKGTEFDVVKEVPCGQVQTADGNHITPINLRVVIKGESLTDERGWRTIPAEYAADLPKVNDAHAVEANQGMRDGNVLAVIGSQYLVEYEMPAGRTFGRVFDVLNPGWHKQACLTNLPKKWKNEIAA